MQRRILDVGIERVHRRRRHSLPTQQGRKDGIHGFAQVNGAAQSVRRVIDHEVNVLVEIIKLLRREDAGVFAETRQFVIVREQFLRLGARTIVKRVDEIEADVSRDQFEFGWPSSL